MRMISRPVVMTVLFGAAGLAVAAVTSRHALIEALAPPWAEPIRVSGLVTSGGQPVNGILITLALADERRIGAEATTDPSGRFTVTVDGPGLYVALVSAHKALSSTSREITIQRGNNYLGIDLPPTEARVTIMGTGPGESSLVQVALHGPADGLGDSRGGFLTGSDGLVARFVGIGYGDYRVSAFTNDERPLTASDCPLPIASLEVEWTRVAETPGRVDMVIKGLPSGAYGFRVTERAPVRTVRTSGETLIYRVPPSCRLCG